MTEHELPELATRLSDFMALYRKDLTPGQLEMWAEDLERFSLDQVRRAMRVYRNSGEKFPPTPGQLIALIEGSPDDNALRQWSRIEEALRTQGSYVSLVFDDPLIHAVISEMGGWIALCSLTIDETPFRRVEFVKRYRGYAQQRVVPPYPRELVGRCAADPRASDRDRTPIMLGNPEDCRRVMAGGADHDRQARLFGESLPAHLAAMKPKALTSDEPAPSGEGGYAGFAALLESKRAAVEAEAESA